MSQLNEILKRLKNEFSPNKVYLFGSRANGTHNDDSDYDFVLVLENHQINRFESMTKARNALRDLGVVADVFIYTKDEFAKLKTEFNSIPELAISEGKELSLDSF